MQNSKIIGIVVVLLTVVVGGYFLLRGGNQAPRSSQTPAPTTGIKPLGQRQQSYQKKK